MIAKHFMSDCKFTDHKGNMMKQERNVHKQLITIYDGEHHKHTNSCHSRMHASLPLARVEGTSRSICGEDRHFLLAAKAAGFLRAPESFQENMKQSMERAR
eukprot:1489267-Amphidinium_carterae.1